MKHFWIYLDVICNLEINILFWPTSQLLLVGLLSHYPKQRAAICSSVCAIQCCPVSGFCTSIVDVRTAGLCYKDVRIFWNEMFKNVSRPYVSWIWHRSHKISVCIIWIQSSLVSPSSAAFWLNKLKSFEKYYNSC